MATATSFNDGRQSRWRISIATSASLVFGKQLSSKLYLSYVKSISGLLDVARLTFNITQRWSLRAEAGTESAVDVLYTFSFK
jgi:translocation and assembly module TamB